MQYVCMLRWTQWIFIQLFNKGLAYQAEVPVNWCPALGTVLANEEIVDGKSERGDHPIERMPMKQVHSFVATHRSAQHAVKIVAQSLMAAWSPRHAGVQLRPQLVVWKQLWNITAGQLAIGCMCVQKKCLCSSRMSPTQQLTNLANVA